MPSYTISLLTRYLVDILPAAKKVTGILKLNVDGADIQKVPNTTFYKTTVLLLTGRCAMSTSHVIPKLSAEKGWLLAGQAQKLISLLWQHSTKNFTEDKYVYVEETLVFLW